VTDTVDPLAGSYYLEHLTNELEARAWAELEKVESEIGGAVKAIETGYYQAAIAEQSYSFERAIESGQRVVVGVNKYRTEEQPATDFFRVDNGALELAQVDKLSRIRASRDEAAVQSSLQALRRAATDPTADLMAPILAAVRAYATLGETSGVMRQVFGEYRAPAII